MKAAEAVALWNELEQRLIRIGLPQDGRLLALRAELVRIIGGAIETKTGESGKRQRVGDRLAPGQRISGAKDRVGPADGSRGKAKRRTDTLSLDISGASSHATVTAEIVRRSSEIYDAKWASMIERACSGKTGYSGDDEVTYEQR